MQLAKVYQLDGKTDLAEEHYNQAHGPSLNTLTAQLYRAALGGSKSMSSNMSSLSQGIGLVLPEDEGLLACGNALQGIERGEFDIARRVIDGTRYVDHLYADFGAVLKYHAQKKIDGTYNYKSNQRVSRIAKRGHLDLQKIVHSISERKFNTALGLERLMCLQIL